MYTIIITMLTMKCIFNLNMGVGVGVDGDANEIVLVWSFFGLTMDGICNILQVNLK